MQSLLDSQAWTSDELNLLEEASPKSDREIPSTNMQEVAEGVDGAGAGAATATDKPAESESSAEGEVSFESIGARNRLLRATVRELELELAQTKLALVESRCREQELLHRVNYCGQPDSARSASIPSEIVSAESRPAETSAARVHSPSVPGSTSGYGWFARTLSKFSDVKSSLVAALPTTSASATTSSTTTTTITTSLQTSSEF